MNKIYLSSPSNAIRIALFFSILGMLIIIPGSILDNFKITALKTRATGCECIIFRLDDVRDGYLENIQMDLMNYFISENESLSLGLIMNQIDNSGPIFQKVNEGYKKGLFELGIHGWDHEDFTRLEKEEQKASLIKSNEKMLSLFGNYSRVFIPPFNLFDNNTISVMESLNLDILSSAIYYDEPKVIREIGEDMILTHSKITHMPEMTDFSIFYNNTWVKVPIKFILADIDFDMKAYGYSVIMVHPHNFAINVNGTLVDDLDENQLKSLGALFHILKLKNMMTSTFYKTADFN